MENVLNNNFGATSGMDLFEFIDKYISVEFERIMEERHKEQQIHENNKDDIFSKDELAIETEGIQVEQPKKVVKGISMSYSFKPNQK